MLEFIFLVILTVDKPSATRCWFFFSYDLVFFFFLIQNSKHYHLLLLLIYMFTRTEQTVIRI